MRPATPDGYTIGFVNVPGCVFPPMYRKTSYDPAQIRLIARVVDDPVILVANRSAGKPQTLKELVDSAKVAPGTISIGHFGDGTTGHLGMLEFERVAGIELISIPHKGSGDAKVSLMGGPGRRAHGSGTGPVGAGRLWGAEIGPPVGAYFMARERP